MDAAITVVKYERIYVRKGIREGEEMPTDEELTILTIISGATC